jgi:hypothetical protein
MHSLDSSFDHLKKKMDIFCYNLAIKILPRALFSSFYRQTQFLRAKYSNSNFFLNGINLLLTILPNSDAVGGKYFLFGDNAHTIMKSQSADGTSKKGLQQPVADTIKVNLRIFTPQTKYYLHNDSFL